jgi:hypothetical protein
VGHVSGRGVRRGRPKPKRSRKVVDSVNAYEQAYSDAILPLILPPARGATLAETYSSVALAARLRVMRAEKSRATVREAMLRLATFGPPEGS